MKHSFHLLSLLVVLFSKQYCFSQDDNTQVWIDERRVSLSFQDGFCLTFSGRFIMEEDQLLVEKEIDYNSEEAEEQPEIFFPGKDDLTFQICEHTDSSLVLHPLNIAAIRASYEMAFEYSLDLDRTDWYKKYLNELDAAKKKGQREKVIQKWRDEQDFYVDTLRFRLLPSLYEQVRIDSICYSTMSFVYFEPDSITYADFKLTADGRFVTSWSRAFVPKESRIEIIPSEEIQLLPPVVTDHDYEENPYYDVEPSFEESVKSNPVGESYLEASAGIYEGKVSARGLNYVNEKVSEIGISTLAGDSMEKSLDYLSYHEQRVRFRVYYNGIYKDFVSGKNGSVEFLLQELIDGLDNLYEDFTEFEPYSGSPVEFPTSYTTTPFKTK